MLEICVHKAPRCVMGCMRAGDAYLFCNAVSVYGGKGSGVYAGDAVHACPSF